MTTSDNAGSVRLDGSARLYANNGGEVFLAVKRIRPAEIRIAARQASLIGVFGSLVTKYAKTHSQ